MSARAVRIAVVPGAMRSASNCRTSRAAPWHQRELLETDGSEHSDGAAAAGARREHQRRTRGRRSRAHAAPARRRHHRLGQVGRRQCHDPVAALQLSPEQCRLILIDPKMLELSVYNGIPHLLDAGRHRTGAGGRGVELGDRRDGGRVTGKWSSARVRNIDAFNAKLAPGAKAMPHIVIVVDEFADLMAVAGKEIEFAVQRLAQMARAAGIHLIMATQRPSVDVITGTIKANFPTRISFRVDLANRQPHDHQ